MKRLYFLFLIIILGYQTLWAQQVDNYRQDTTTLYQRTNGFYTDPLRSKWRKEVKQHNGFWIVSLFDRKFGLQEEISFSDKELSERKGPYRRYHEGKLILEGDYDQGYKVGEWKNFYSNAQIKEVRNYALDQLNGKAVGYWEDGGVKAQRSYTKGKRSGMWRLYYPDGKVALHEIYTTTGSQLMGLYFNKEGDSVTRDEVLTLPRYSGGDQGLARYLSRQLTAFKEEFYKPFKVIFSVSSEGWLYDIAVESNSSPAFQHAVIRALRQSERWIPGTELGTAVDMQQEMLFGNKQ